jgi:hypothetical protein
MAKHFSKRNINNYVLYKDLSTGKHADVVQILINKANRDLIVKKKYNSKHENIFYNEVYWHLYLSTSNIVPRIIRVDPSSLCFWMTHCGKVISDGTYQSEIAKMTKKLEKEYHCYHNDVKADNVCLKNDNKLYLIDLGWMSDKPLKAGYGNSKEGHKNPDLFADMKEKCLALIKEKAEILPSD